MYSPQPGIFAQGTHNHYHLEFEIHSDAASDLVRSSIRSFLELRSSLDGVLNAVIGFGPIVSEILFNQDLPASFSGFSQTGISSRHSAPATQKDIWVWLHANDSDVLFDAACSISSVFSPIGTLNTEVPCFLYQAGRDMTGFIDGTENPSLAKAPEVAVVPDSKPGAGGSIAIVMRWVHNLRKFNDLSLLEQEKVIGRTKLDSVELPDDIKPPTAHISRVVIQDDDSNEIEIYRRSVPYGTTNEHGLFFVAFSQDQTRFQSMLDAMFGLSSDALFDQLLDYSTPVSGSYYFVPSLQALSSI